MKNLPEPQLSIDGDTLNPNDALGSFLRSVHGRINHLDHHAVETYGTHLHISVRILEEIVDLLTLVLSRRKGEKRIIRV